jgi:Domain of unknown function (DUF397)
MDLSTATWRKSSRSQGGGQNCVEVAVIRGAVAIRDSKDPEGPVQIISPDSFRDLITRIKHGELDLS